MRIERTPGMRAMRATTSGAAALSRSTSVYAISPFDDWHRQAWAGALVLLTLIFLTSLSVRLLTRGRVHTAR